MWKVDFAQGNEAFQRSQFKAAYQHFSSSLLKDPGNIVILDCRAATSEKLGRYEDVLQDARLMVKSEPLKARGYIRMIKALNASKQKAKAQQIVHVALKRVPVSDKLYQALKALKTTEEIIRPAKNYWPLLPTELIWSIFCYLTLEDRARCLMVCRHWYQFFINEPTIWRTIEIKSYYRLTIRNLQRYIKYADPSGLRQLEINWDWSYRQKVIPLLLSCNLSTLQHLQLKLPNISMDDLHKLVKKVQNSLRYLDLSYSATLIQAYVFLNACPNLEKLVCQECIMESNPNAYFEKSLSLKTFAWEGICENAEQLLTFIRQLPNLNTLYLQLHKCSSGDNVISLSDIMLELPHLYSLDLKLPPISMPSQPSEEKRLKLQKHASNLQALRLNCRFEDWELKAIMESCASKLQSLTLDNIRMSDPAILHMSILPLDRLQRLDISTGHFQDSRALQLLIKACPDLKYISLCSINVTDDCCLKALKNCEKLDYVNIDNSPLVTGSGIRSLATSHPMLSRLSAYNCPRIDLDAIQYAQSIVGFSKCCFGAA
ncbi:hypothetical protein INT43_000366 [Umbelopsis isabellina]|uniref:F-box domain-containing protein n=1 Tax=Mortierella isabellina TaxID=91625 RepID=A0A8H7Q1Z8_MORIS|nr:hypothetical protein INT43_000366 [Umbelopsis isabellina]